MSASLVGSEMCIRDRCGLEGHRSGQVHQCALGCEWGPAHDSHVRVEPASCLLYTSDAADDM
eukprot:3841427-Alexandrium_andersonii.AAC.1